MRNTKILLTAAALLLPLLAVAVDLAALVRDGERKDALAAISSGHWVVCAPWK
jgi:hypothetical protein